MAYMGDDCYAMGENMVHVIEAFVVSVVEAMV